MWGSACHWKASGYNKGCMAITIQGCHMWNQLKIKEQHWAIWGTSGEVRKFFSSWAVNGNWPCHTVTLVHFVCLECISGWSIVVVHHVCYVMYFFLLLRSLVDLLQNIHKLYSVWYCIFIFYYFGRLWHFAKYFLPSIVMTEVDLKSRIISCTLQRLVAQLMLCV